jgi:hypothetical protein
MSRTVRKVNVRRRQRDGFQLLDVDRELRAAGRAHPDGLGADDGDGVDQQPGRLPDQLVALADNIGLDNPGGRVAGHHWRALISTMATAKISMAAAIQFMRPSIFTVGAGRLRRRTRQNHSR